MEFAPFATGFPLDKHFFTLLQQKGQTLGWAVEQTEVRKVIDILNQPISDNSLMVSPC